MKILVTGANGFVGHAVWRRLNSLRGVHVVGSLRQASPLKDLMASSVILGDLTAQTNWSAVLPGTGVVVHTAARVHVMRDTTNDPLTEFRRVNVLGTLQLGRQAAAAGVARFVYVSSAKVNGEASLPDCAFRETAAPRHQDAYGVSKHEAEQGLLELAAVTGMEVVIIRPPVVYGPGVKANFASLMHAVQRGWPLPLAAIHNQRSLVALDNLVDFIITCAMHPKAANETFLVSDGHDLSTTELASGLAKAMNVPIRLLPLPVWILQATARLAG